MTREIAQSIIDTAWDEIVQRKANADVAIAEKRWESAGNQVTRLRYACSDLEHGLVMMRWVERDSAAAPKPGEVLMQSPLGTQQLACGNRVPVENPTTIRVQ